jgi:putative cardiolipin synthase
MNRAVRRSSIAARLSLITSVLVAGGCAGLPKLDGRIASTALTDTDQTRLGKAVHAAAAANPGSSGIRPLQVPQDAFAARALLARAAERSLDVQYYIWNADTTGHLLLAELWAAAERGVRVRLLLDDNGVAGLDPAIAALDSHASIEVRLFNPFVNRRVRMLGYITDFGRLNRRMHNKSYTVDSRATIVGGRNVGDEYFGAGEGMVFSDLDVIAVGPVVADVARAFDEYWNSDSAYPAELIVGKAAKDAVPALMARFEAVRTSADAVEYVDALRATRLVEELLAQRLSIEWVPVRLVYDAPAKGLGKAEPSDLLLASLRQALGTPEREIDLISPYFVPGKEGTEGLAGYAERGIRLRILTNSLAATDVAAVHAGYAKRRKPLLRSGVGIYELKPDADAREKSRKEDKSAGGSSDASLHAKTFSVDRKRAFVGSFNLDPRSVNLNTEMGVVIESPQLAGAISSALDRQLPVAAYEVTLAEDGRGLQWIERTQQGEVRHSSEPHAGVMKRLGVGFMSILPIEWML